MGEVSSVARSWRVVRDDAVQAGMDEQRAGNARKELQDAGPGAAAG